MIKNIRKGMNKPKPHCIDIREKRSLALHRSVVVELRKNPALWTVAFANLDRWGQQGALGGHAIWLKILHSMSRDEILKLLVARSENAIDLRKLSPFVGIISQEKRNKIFEKWRLRLEYITEVGR